jgi:hypothetical protein
MKAALAATAGSGVSKIAAMARTDAPTYTRERRG